MTILATLEGLYQRLASQGKVPVYGYSVEKIGIVVGLNEDGSVATVTDWRTGEGRKRQPRQMLVPQPVKRTAGIAPNFLWDKTSYALGVTAGEGRRTAEEHKAFVERHLRELGDSDDPGLQAFVRFLQRWTPDQFAEPLWPEDLKDQNVVFALENERLQKHFLHDRPAAQALWAHQLKSGHTGEEQICLVTGDKGPVARLHPSIKGVWGAQSSGAALVSFNLDAFESYGHSQGENAPVSEVSAFAYTTALNFLLGRDSGHRLQIGDASTVFWAEANDEMFAEQAEELFSLFFDLPNDAGKGEDEAATRKIEIQLKRIREDRHLEEIEPQLGEGVRFHVLGLAPNAARLSVRFHFSNSFGELTRHYQAFVSDMRIEPPPDGGHPPLWRYLLETAVQGKRENVAPNLAGEWMRAILSGGRYPWTLMSSVLTRIRADGKVNARRAAILKAILTRNFQMEAPVALDPDNRNRGYLLGRLFAVYEQIQTAALGTRVNATIKDKYYGSASATPRKIFPMLESGSANHLSKLGKDKPGYRVTLERQVAEIMDMMSPDADPFPVSLSAEEQALFGLGYYHQRSAYFNRTRQSDTNTSGGTDE